MLDETSDVETPLHAMDRLADAPSGTGRCVLHGGGCRGGSESQQFETGQDSKVQTGRITELIAHYEAEPEPLEGKSQDVGGYYHPSSEKTYATIRPSATLNEIVDGIEDFRLKFKKLLKF